MKIELPPGSAEFGKIHLIKLFRGLTSRSLKESMDWLQSLGSKVVIEFDYDNVPYGRLKGILDDWEWLVRNTQKDGWMPDDETKATIEHLLSRLQLKSAGD